MCRAICRRFVCASLLTIQADHPWRLSVTKRIAAREQTHYWSIG